MTDKTAKTEKDLDVSSGDENSSSSEVTTERIEQLLKANNESWKEGR